MSEDSNSSDSVELDNCDTSFDDSYDVKPFIDDGQPRIEISEQPQSRGFRFRYKCEGPSHGGLQGVTSERGNKKYPSVKIANYVGSATVVVSLVTDEDDPRPHAHELIGKNCKNGMCNVTIPGGTDMTVSFQNLGIQHVTKRKVVDVLTERILNETLGPITNNNINALKNFTNEQKQEAKGMAQEQAKCMQLNVVRLCFRAILHDIQHQPPPVFSNSIYDSKSPGTAALKICRMDKHAGCCEGNDEVFLLCDKVQKDDISVRFFETDEDGQDRWESYGTFGPSDVHRQYAIVFKTPAYRDMTISRPINVQVQLKRVSDGAISDAKPFTYYPKQHDRDDVEKKRKKPLPGFGGGRVGGGGGGSPFANGSFSGFGGGLENLGPFGGQSNNSDGNQRYNIDLDTLIALNNLTTSYKRPAKRMKRFRHYRRPVDNIDSTDSSDCEYSTGDSATFEMDPGLEGDLSSIDEIDGGMGCSALFTSELVERLSISDLSPKKKQTKTEIMVERRNKINKSKSAAINPPVVLKSQEATLTSQAPQETGGLLKEMEKLRKQIKNYEEIDQFEHNMLYCIGVSMAKSLQAYAATGKMEHLLTTYRRLVADADKSGDTSLHLSVIHNQLPVLETLLKLVEPLSDHSVINVQNVQGQTALHLATLTKQTKAMKLLLQHGADPSIRDCHGNTVIHLAAQESDCVYLQFILKETQNLVIHADLDVLNYDGLSALHLAIMKGLLRNVKLLSQYLACVEVQEGKSGLTPLHMAAQLNSLPIVSYLVLECDADVNARCYDGNTPLHFAVSADSHEVVALLVSNGANPDAENLDDTERDVVDTEKSVDDTERMDDTGRSVDESDGAWWGGSAQRNGVTPRELAAGSALILQALNGKTTTSLRKNTFDFSKVIGDEMANCDPGLPDSMYDVPGSTLSGDMTKLDKQARKEIAKFLDKQCCGKDWIALSEWLDMGGLVNEIRHTPSPTCSLLLQYQLEGGTVQNLEECLVQMGRRDAVAVIKEAKKTHPVEKSKGNHEGNCDSGIESIGSLHSSEVPSLSCR